jgi:hypothetical protein
MQEIPLSLATQVKKFLKIFKGWRNGKMECTFLEQDNKENMTDFKFKKYDVNASLRLWTLKNELTNTNLQQCDNLQQQWVYL